MKIIKYVWIDLPKRGYYPCEWPLVSLEVISTTKCEEPEIKFNWRAVAILSMIWNIILIGALMLINN